EEFIFAHQYCPPDWVWGYPLLRTCYTPHSDQHWAAVMAKLHGYIHREVEAELSGPSSLRFHPAGLLKSYLEIARAGGEVPPYPELDRAPTDEVKRRLRIQVVEDRAALENVSVEKAREYYNGLRAQGMIEEG